MKYLTSLLLCVLLVASVNSVSSFSSPSNLANTPVEGRIDVQIFEDSLQSLYSALELDKAHLSFNAFRYAMIGYHEFSNAGKLNDSQLISIIDFTQASTEKRFYTIDLKNKKLVFHSLVSHGKNTGENFAKSFSNKLHSNQSSLGFYITGETYVGSKGYSMRLDGMDPGYNDNMRARAVVMHDADYVSEKWIRAYGRLGRSQGCPALPKEISRKVIDTIKNKTLVFAYAEQPEYLAASSHLQLEKILDQYAIAMR